MLMSTTTETQNPETKPLEAPPKSKATTTETPKPAMYYVLDSLARHDVPRQHEIIIRTYDDGREPDTVTYQLLSQGNGTEMPMEHAMKFLSDKAFIVKNPLGDRIMPPASVEGGLGGMVLEPDQTVAFYNELSRPALFKRCKVLPGGERISVDDSTATMIEFLMAWEEHKKSPTGEDTELLAKLTAGGLGGAADKGTLDKMFN
jgi:hypothetical protein